MEFGVAESIEDSQRGAPGAVFMNEQVSSSTSGPSS
jgi:hypothetical protein